MAKITFRGLDEYVAALEKLSGDAESMIARSIYPGAAIIANEIKSRLSALNTRVPGKYYENGEKAPGPTPQEKADLISAFGLAPMRTDGFYTNTKAGFDGYSAHRTDSYQNGVPIPLIARSCESGTSWMKKQPFMRQAVNSARKKAELAIIKTFDDETKKHMG